MLKTFALPPSEWKKAKPPNYNINEDLEYPYSECPFLGEYNLLKIPQTGLIEHVDFWGEGRIEVGRGISGFPDCYNVNHTYKLVSNGNDETINRKIANRIPVVSYSDCRTDSYIKDSSVKIVTLMGAPINESCAEDIARMLYEEEGIAVVYGMDRNTADVNILEETLNQKKIIYCPGFELPERLQGVTLFDNHLAFVNLTDFKEILYYAITSADYDYAVSLSLELKNANREIDVRDILERLLKGDNPKTMMFVYKLWIGGGEDIVTERFPSEFQHILRSDNMQMISKYYNQAMKLDANIDDDNDRVAWGDANDKTSIRIIWRFIPQIDNDHIYFKINNNEHDMFLKLDYNPDSVGDRTCFGSTSSEEKRHLWALEPIRHNDELLFFIVNYEYQQALKLTQEADEIGDRVVCGHNGIYADNPDYFGWFFKAM